LTARSEGFSRQTGAWQNATGRFPVAREASARLFSGLSGIGATLREAREGLGISFEVAERDTHIPRHHLQALEEERFDAFHAPVYVRGFLRSYSQYLRLDSGELLALLPPDRPVEDERLMPLSRLGRPRGPREAARERHDPAARDAAPLTSTNDQISDPPFDTRSTSEVARAGATGLLIAPRIDPLGRLGWPEGPNEAREQDEISANSAHVQMAGYTRPANVANPAWERPLNPRRTRHWEASPKWQMTLPSDTQALFERSSMLAVLACAAALTVLLAFFLGLGGGDVSPTVLATNGASGVDAAIALPAGTTQMTAHGSMPNLQGSALGNALPALQSQGVVPIVLVEGGPSSANQQVTAQIPSPGAELHPQSAVLLVVGGG
jgi:helix-turn-helix protein/PASTA domain-containing protein